MRFPQAYDVRVDFLRRERYNRGTKQGDVLFMSEKKVKQGSFFHRNRGWLIPIITIVALALVVVLLCVSTYIPRCETTDYDSAAAKSNGYIVKTPLVSAHRAGRTIAPENTMAAFKACFDNMTEYSVDVLEFDLHLTKDDQLILLHDDTLDRTSDCVEKYGEKDVKPRDKTVEELKRYNMGYHFQDEKTGEYPYRQEDADLTFCRIVTLEEVLDYLKTREAILGKELNYIIEIKNGKEDGYKATDKLYATMEAYGITKRTIVGTFKGEVSKYIDEHCPNMIRSAGIAEVLGFYFSCMFGVKLDKVGYKVLQIPYKDFGLNLGKKAIVDYAHKYGIAVQYWTINKAEDIRYLTDIGADCIISDNPRLAYDIIYKKA